MREQDFEAFPKIPRLRRNAVVTEKIDGTNAAVYIVEHPFGAGVNLREDYPQALTSVCGDERAEDGLPVSELFIYAQSRNRFITPEADNYGFAAWVLDNAVELAKLGPGRHFGEWYGLGIQRGYGLDHKRFALFNTGRWLQPMRGVGIGPDDRMVGPKMAIAPDCCDVVPVLRIATYSDVVVELAIWELMNEGSRAVPGFMNPEGVVVYHTASRQTYKRLIEGDEVPKSLHNYHSEESVA